MYSIYQKYHIKFLFLSIINHINIRFHKVEQYIWTSMKPIKLKIYKYNLTYFNTVNHLQAEQLH